jgi:hypothetical protein
MLFHYKNLDLCLDFKQMFAEHSDAIKGNMDGSTHTNWRLVRGWLHKDVDLCRGRLP